MNDPIRSLNDADLVAAVEAYAKALAEGHWPDRQALLAAHPQMAGDLNACLDALELMHCFAPEPGEVKGHRTSPPDRAGRESAGEVSRLAKVGNFRLLREIGRGGMGVVYEAQQTDLKRRVALKILPFAAMLDRRQLNRFKTEAQAAAGLHHTNIVPVYSFGCQDGVYYYAMQYIEGQTLGQVIAGFPDRTVSMPESPQRPFALGEGAIATESMELPQASPSVASPEQPESIAEHDSQPVNRDATPPWLNDSSWKSVGWCRRVAEMGIQVAEALEHAHQQGILHRDVKPGNLLLDVEGNVWVTDFGLAQIEAGTKLTLTGDVLGTLRYMSPEQAGGGSGRVDCRSDVYSLGITLYELLTLRPAFSQQRRELLLAQVLSEDSPPPPSRLNRAIPRDLETIVQKATAKVPAERYETAADVADDLRRFLDGRPIRARRPSPLDRLAKWTRRHAPIAVTTAAFVAVLAISLLLLSIRHAAREHEARVEAEEARRDSEAARIDAEGARRDAEDARTDAETAQLGAESARVAAETVTGYLVDAFRSPDPERDGRTITVAEVLDRTVQELEGQLADQPLIKARLLYSLGQSYRALGLYHDAVYLFQEALELREHEFGHEHSDTLHSMNGLALTYLDVGRLEEAVTLCEQTLELRKATLGPEHPDTLSSMNNLGMSYYAVKRLDEAIALHEQTLDIKRATLGPEHAATLPSMNNLAMAYRAVERLDEAIALQEETLKLQGTTLGAEHPDALLSMNNLALAYQDAGRLDEAIAMREQTLEPLKVTLGFEHPYTLTSMNNLAGLYRSAGRIDEAIALHEQTLEQRKATLGPKDPDTLTSMNNLAIAYRDAGRLNEAISLHQPTLELRKATLGHEHPDTLSTINHLATAYHAAGRLNEALPLHEQAWEQQKATLGAEHPDTLRSMRNLAAAYHTAGRLDEAIALQEEEVELTRATLGREHPDTLTSMNNLASVYRSAERLDEAIELHEETLELIKATLGHEHRYTLFSMINLALAYQDAERLGEAIALLEPTLELMKATLGPEHPSTLTCMGNLADVYQDTKRLDEAISLYEQTLELRKATLGSKHSHTTGTMGSLASSYLAASRYAEAEEYARQCLRIRLEQIPDDWRTYNTMCLLGRSLVGQGRLEDAEPLLVDGYQGMIARENSIPAPGRVRLTEALTALVQLYEDWDKPEEAERWRSLRDAHDADPKSPAAGEEGPADQPP